MGEWKKRTEPFILMNGMGFPIVFSLIIFILASVVVGAATILTTFFRAMESQKTKRKHTIQTILQELEEKAKTDHSSELQSVLRSYNTELQQLEGSEQPLDIHEKNTQSQPQPSSPAQPQVQKAKREPMFDWENWYSEHSISLLLYIGALLIILTASILVAFSWQSMSGMAKAFLLSLTSLSFIGSGLVFMKNKSVHHAGSTFTAIGTMLITFAGIGWYSFVLKDMGIAYGWVGVVSSVLTIFMSIGLSFLVQGKFFPYLTSLGMIASMLSLIQISGPALEWYVFTSQLMSFVFLAMKKAYLGTTQRELSYQDAAEHIGQLLMPVSVIVGLGLAAQQGLLFEVKPALAVLVAGVYYTISYLVYKMQVELYAAQILFPLGTGMLLYALKFPMEIVFVVPSCMYLCWSVAGVWKKNIEMGIIGMFGTSIIAILGASQLPYQSVVPSILTALALSATIATFVVSNQEILFFPIAIAMGVGTVQLIRLCIGTAPDPFVYLVYALLSFVWYMVPRMLPGRTNQQKQLATVIAGFFFVLTFVLVQHHPLERFLLASAGVLFTVVCVLYKERLGISVFTMVVAWFFWDLLQLFHAEYSVFVVVFAVFGYVLFGISRYVQENRSRWEAHVFFVLLVVPFVFPPLLALDYTGNSFVWFSIVALVCATAFVSFIAYVEQRKALFYTVSIPGMFLLSWVLVLLEMKEVSVHGLVWGIYLLVMGLFKRKDGKHQDADALDVFGMMVLFGPGIVDAFSANPTAALITGVSGIGLIAFGITRTRKLFSSIGGVGLFLAIVSQTYEYILGLEQWMITGILGLIFLAGAITLLVKKSRKNM